jgi:tetratricopeptide (TPR) repeat protein
MEPTATAYGNRGFLYYRNKDYDRAIADFAQVLVIDPDNKIAVDYLRETQREKVEADVRKENGDSR